MDRGSWTHDGRRDAPSQGIERTAQQGIVIVGVRLAGRHSVILDFLSTLPGLTPACFDPPPRCHPTRRWARNSINFRDGDSGKILWEETEDL